jgi:hypothetical protein
MIEYSYPEFKPSKMDEIPSQGSIPFNLFQLRNDASYYMIELEPGKDHEIFLQSLGFERINPLLEDDEIYTGDEGVYTWIIGTKLNHNLESDGQPTSCDPSKLHLWCKKTQSQQEIRTKHADIIYSSMSKKNYEEFDVDYNVIDYLLYAGELVLKRINGNYNIYINFLSGTYMDGVVNAKNPSDYTKQCVSNVFKYFAEYADINPNNVQIVFDTTTKTYINDEYQMTEPLLNEFIYRGAKIYRFPNKPDALAVKNKSLNLARLNGTLSMYERMGNQQLIQDTLNKIRDLESINKESYRVNLQPIRYGGTKKKRKSIKRKKRNTRRKKSMKYNKRRFVKRK